MTTKLYRTWVERLTAPEIAKSHIAAFRQIYVRSMGYPNQGKRSALTLVQCGELVDVFYARSDAGPNVTATQAEQGRRWLAKCAKRMGMPTDVDYSAITHFTFVGVEIVSTNSYRMETAPEYVCHWADGKALKYAPTPWAAGLGLPEWSWI